MITSDPEDGELEDTQPSVIEAHPAELHSQENILGIEEKDTKEHSPGNGESSNPLPRALVPDPPPSPPEKWEIPSRSKKSQKKKIMKSHRAGKPVGASLYRSVYGPQAKPEIIVDYKCQPIRVVDVQSMLLWILTDNSGSSPSWALVKNVPLVKQVVLVYVPGVSSRIFQQRQDLFPCLSKLKPVVTMASKDALIRPGYATTILLSVPYAKNKRQYLKAAAAGLDPKDKERPFPPSHYVLKPDMMARMGYPLPETAEDGQQKLPADFVMTQPRSTDGNGVAESKEDVLLALDCEMCETSPGLYELTRITLLTDTKQVLYDELCLPFNAITDYHTDKSGITAETLEGVQTRLADIQRRFLELVPAETILIGHALENDLKALKVLHMRCIDTGALFPHPRGLPARPALRRLSEKFLKRKIQSGTHNPIEDATAALDLALLKMKCRESLYQKFSYEPSDDAHSLTGFKYSTAGFQATFAASLKAVIFVQPKWLADQSAGAADGIPCSSDEEVRERLISEVAKTQPPDAPPRMVWAQFRAPNEFYENRAQELRKTMLGASNAAGDQEQGVYENGNGTAEGDIKQQGNSQKKPASTDSAQEGAQAGKRVSPSENFSRNKRQHTEGAADVSDAPQVEGLEISSGEASKGESKAPRPEPSEQMEEGEQAASEEERILLDTDRMIGDCHAAMPADSILIIASCQGDAALTRIMNEQRLKRINGLIQPAWSEADEKHYVTEVAEVGRHGFCIATVI